MNEDLSTIDRATGLSKLQIAMIIKIATLLSQKLVANLSMVEQYSPSDLFRQAKSECIDDLFGMGKESIDDSLIFLEELAYIEMISYIELYAHSTWNSALEI